jgi:tetratricopeptide (TPR) repeat protein
LSRPRALLAAAIIVKNEADHLRRCLLSLRDVCDEIVVVDTGSDDDSVQCASHHGARVLQMPWGGDFSAARNHGLDNIDATWVLYVDADEELQPIDSQHVRRSYEQAVDENIVAYLVRFRVKVGWTPYWEYRTWQHRDDIRFRGAMHETMVPDLRRIVAAEGLRIERGPLTLQHYGYEGDQSHKHRRNLPLLEKQVSDLPHRVYLWNHLGQVRGALGDVDGAEAAFRTGFDLVRRRGLVEDVDILVVSSLTFFLMSRSRHDEARGVLDEGLALAPEHFALLLADARLRALRGDHLGAIERLDELLAVEAAVYDNAVLAYNPSLFSAWPAQLRAESLFDLGRYGEAAASYEAAGAMGAADLEMRTKAALSRRLAGNG